VTLDGFEKMKSNRESVTMIPFHGQAEGSLFRGIILPGGVDTQIHTTDGRTKLSARYMLEGEDCMGNHCRVFIENEGIDEGNGIITTPKILTDSPYLSRLETSCLRGTVSGEENGVLITIYEEEQHEKNS